MRTFYKIVADELSALDMFNSMWNTKCKVGDVVAVCDSDVILSFNDLHRLCQEISIFYENYGYGKVHLEELQNVRNF